ncbi:site-specific DNA-methyltransferase (adenine-specific) [Lishizhenia tianjinensis]|uniref:Methyltransferase n=1 Tax=Lishizhenia tianjinensis TaxID=477690 RepID=A0A1I7AR61_9FLAO|nr:site-specific DNA-methyltransferase [Lishizhenia tianjinensis]SFT77414.1 site-specific DNA-methyltransferase (adenine-specific) [Lishizhenia tianjinensis]
MKVNEIYIGNCIDTLKKFKKESVDLVYMDPPFFTQRKHSLSTRDESKKYEFDDSWYSIEDYLIMIEDCLTECKRVLKSTGSIFLHCDKAASHNLRVSLDKVFGNKNFQSEIIWSYRRWSNSKKGLLNAHQNIYFYSKSKDFKFNPVFKDYAPTTNVDQILQDRQRTKNGKSVYKKDENGNVVLGKEKKGVPLSDVWEIPYLNPKAKERVGYPTQKPVLLLQQILEITTDEGDLVLDPFNGSGTTCVAAKSMDRNFIGIDMSPDAVELAKQRLEDMIITGSALLEKGVNEYNQKNEEELALLKSIDAIPVQRNSGIDGFLKEHYKGKPVPVKIQSEYESLNDAKEKLERSSANKGYELKILIQTKEELETDRLFELISDIQIVKSPKLLVDKLKIK